MKVKVDVLHREAKASLASLEEAQLTIRGLETDKAELQATKVRLLEQVRDVKKDLANKTLMVQEVSAFLMSSYTLYENHFFGSIVHV